MVLERDGVCRNSHLSPKGHARHTRHADHTTTNLQVKAPSADLSGSLPRRPGCDTVRNQNRTRGLRPAAPGASHPHHHRQQIGGHRPVPGGSRPVRRGPPGDPRRVPHRDGYPRFGHQRRPRPRHRIRTGRHAPANAAAVLGRLRQPLRGLGLRAPDRQRHLLSLIHISEPTRPY